MQISSAVLKLILEFGVHCVHLPTKKIASVCASSPFDYLENLFLDQINAPAISGDDTILDNRAAIEEPRSTEKTTKEEAITGAGIGAPWIARFVLTPIPIVMLLTGGFLIRVKDFPSVNVPRILEFEKNSSDPSAFIKQMKCPPTLSDASLDHKVHNRNTNWRREMAVTKVVSFTLTLAFEHGRSEMIDHREIQLSEDIQALYHDGYNKLRSQTDSSLELYERLTLCLECQSRNRLSTSRESELKLLMLAESHQIGLSFCKNRLWRKINAKAENVKELDGKLKGICIQKGGRHPTGMVSPMAKAGGFTCFLLRMIDGLNFREFVPFFYATGKKSCMTNIGGENSRWKPMCPPKPRQDFGFQSHLGVGFRILSKLGDDYTPLSKIVPQKFPTDRVEFAMKSLRSVWENLPAGEINERRRLILLHVFLVLEHDTGHSRLVFVSENQDQISTKNESEVGLAQGRTGANDTREHVQELERECKYEV
ncbi:hypothetical protein Tco_0126964 [Tanacetum coccineum]